MAKSKIESLLDLYNRSTPKEGPYFQQPEMPYLTREQFLEAIDAEIQAAESRGRAEQAGLDALRVRQHRETVAELIEADAKHFSGETK